MNSSYLVRILKISSLFIVIMGFALFFSGKEAFAAAPVPEITGISEDTGIDASDGITKDNTLVFNGTTNVRTQSAIEVFIGGSSIGTVNSDVDGSWSYDYSGTTLTDGSYQITAQATDQAGNTGDLSAAYTVKVDTTAPSLTMVRMFISGEPGVTQANIGDQIELEFDSDEKIQQPEVTMLGSSLEADDWEYTQKDWIAYYSIIEGGTDGSANFKINFTDYAGNSGTQVTQTGLTEGSLITVDANSPETPVISGISDDTGISNTDRITNDTSLTVTGTAEPNTTVNVRDGMFINTDTQTDGSGNWSVNIDMTYSAGLNVCAIDDAGNSSAYSGDYDITIDTTAPAAPTFAGITDDTGSSAVDGLTNDQTLAFQGTAEANAQVDISLNEQGVIGSVTADQYGDWEFDYTGTTLAEGTHVLTAFATDLAGNKSGETTHTFTINTTPPNKPVISGIDDDSGVSGTDGITNRTTNYIRGTAASGSTVEIFKDDVSLGTTTAESGNWSMTYYNFADGSYDITAHATDIYGNVSATSDTYLLTIDSTRPTVTLTDDDANDYVKAGDIVTITAEFSEIMANTPTISLSNNVGVTDVGMTDSGDHKTWTYAWTVPSVSDRQVTVTVNGSDVAGNDYSDYWGSDSISFKIDNTKPVIGYISISEDTGNIYGDCVTSDSNLQINGSAETESVVEVSLDGVVIGTTATEADSQSWRFDYTDHTLEEGIYTLKAKATDQAGNVGEREITIVIDTTGPTKIPVITGISEDTGISSSDGITANDSFTINGTGEAGSVIEVSIGGISLRSTTTVDSEGNWSIESDSPGDLALLGMLSGMRIPISDPALDEGTHELTACATDVAGNKTADSETYIVTIDKTAPDIKELNPVNGDEDVEVDGHLSIKFNEKVGTGTGYITIYDASDASVIEAIDVTSEKVTGSGSDTITINSENLTYDAEYYVYVDAAAITDIAGNGFSGISDQTIWHFTTMEMEKSNDSSSHEDDDDNTLTEAIFLGENSEVNRSIEIEEKTGNVKTTIEQEDLDQLASADSNKTMIVKVEIPEVEGSKQYALELPQKSLAEKPNMQIEMKTELGSITIPGNMLSNQKKSQETARISIGKVNKNQLGEKTREIIGDRPIVELNVAIGDQTIAWHNSKTPVTVVLPYKPTPEELSNPEHIVVWYINEEGKAIVVPNGKYKPETGMVTFKTNHFSQYAVGYNSKTFNDLKGFQWAQKQVEVLASKGIINGTSETAFSPNLNITRADFLVLLVRTLELEVDFEQNFDDVKSDQYYYTALGVAKALGIAKGSDNHFNPEKNITRQDMMVFTDRGIRYQNKISQVGKLNHLDQFADHHMIANYAMNSTATLFDQGLIKGSDGKINPLENTTRAEAAVLLYRIYHMD